MSRSVDEEITHIVMQGERVVTTHGSTLRLWLRGRPVLQYQLDYPVEWMSRLGSVLTLLTSDSVFHTIEVKGSRRGRHTFTELSSVPLIGESGSSSVITTMCHPQTYINKFVVGRKDGNVELWNIRKGKLIYNYSSVIGRVAHMVPRSFTPTQGEGPLGSVTVLQNSPALDVVAVGFSSGLVVLLHLRFALVLGVLRETTGMPVAISFASSNKPLLAVGMDTGTVSLWNLGNMSLQQLVFAHSGSIHSLEWLPGEDLLLSAASDNTIKIWVQDQEDGTLRLLKSREGHSRPANQVHWYPDEFGSTVFSCAPDRTLRRFNTFRSRQSRELSQGPGLQKKSIRLGVTLSDLKQPAITHFDANSLRETQWPNLVAAHEGCDKVTFWSTDSDSLRSTVHTSSAQPATAVCVGTCGNYAAAGSRGAIDCWAVQSSRLAGVFRPDESHSAAGSSPVLLATDSFSTSLVSVWGNGLITTHDIADPSLREQRSLFLGQSAVMAAFCPATDLLAVVLSDFSLAAVDVRSLRVARRLLAGLPSAPVSLCFSGSGQMLYVGTVGAIMTVDCLHSRVVDTIEMSSAQPLLSLSVSPDDTYLLTSHADSPALRLWISRQAFEGVDAEDAPAAEEAGTDSIPDGEDTSPCYAELRSLGVPVPREAETTRRLPTLSGLPSSRWVTLPQLDLIRERQKPVEAPKAPERAPFFLTQTTDSSGNFAAASDAVSANPDSTGRVAENDDTEAQQGREELLRKSGLLDRRPNEVLAEGKPARALAVWTNLPPAAAEREIRLLSVANTEESSLRRSEKLPDADVSQFLDMIQYCLINRVCTEFAGAWLLVLLRVHGSEIARNKRLAGIISEIGSGLRETWGEIESPVMELLSMLDFSQI